MMTLGGSKLNCTLWTGIVFRNDLMRVALPAKVRNFVV